MLGGCFEQDDLEAVRAVLEAATGPGGDFFPLAEETEFQQAFARHEGAACCVAVNSCGTALDLCMMALGIGPGDEVITTPLTFVCTATCASARGARVVFADIDPHTLCLDSKAVEAKISPRTKAIIPVHFAGLAADINAFDRISAATGIPVVYDSAHAVGALANGRPLGGRGRASCYSFQSNKNMTTLGEGGAITTNDPDFAEQVRLRKTFGYVYGAQLRITTVGFNYRMTKPQLAAGRTQLAKIDRVNAQKRAAMRRLSELLADVDEIILPAGLEEGHAAHLYVIRLDSTRCAASRDALREHLKREHQIGTGIHYPAVWSWEVFNKLDHDRRDCPIAERACREVLSLPVVAQSTEEEMEYIAWALKQSIAHLRRTP
jgi:dTDP-4-amino-4,6-dideoxygalactose transaminase